MKDKKIEIWGAGLAGLIAANMLRKYNPVVYEAQESLPNNHKALLRFRTDRVSLATGIPFKKVEIKKAIWDGYDMHTSSNLFLENTYSLKATDTITKRSISNFQGETRYIAPQDFIERLAEGIKIEFGTTIKKVNPESNNISTLPMFINNKIAGIESDLKFEAKEIHTVNFYIESPHCDVYQTIYDVSDSPFYRTSISGNEVICEGRKESIDLWKEVCKEKELELKAMLAVCFGIGSESIKISEPTFNSQRLGKILKVDENKRRNNILNLSRDHSIYSLGRFATWRQIMLDDIINDVETIEKLIKQDSYHATIYNCKKGE